MPRRPSDSPGRALAAIGAAACLLLAGCSLRWPVASRDAEVYQRAETLRVRLLEREVERLRADLRQAEEAMVSIESGLRAMHSRADAVSALAEARIAVERAARAAPWREAAVLEARAKLAEGERQVQAGHFGSALFFASRAQRIGEALEAEARAVASARDARFVRSPKASLHAAPGRGERVVEVLPRDTPVFPERGEDGWLLVSTVSGRVGWIQAALLRSR